MAQNNTNNAIFSLTFAFTDHVTYDKVFKMPGITLVDTAMFEAVHDVILVYPNNVEIIQFCVLLYCTAIQVPHRIYYLPIIPRARMGSESKAHEAVGLMGY